jgi:hypothetical protein
MIPAFTPTAFMPKVVVAYTGPGDIVSGAQAWWGLRAYSAATAGTKAINIRASGDNATTDINTLANGDLDVATVSSFLGIHGGNAFVTKLYEQTGGGADQIQATAANQPQLILSGLGSLPVMKFVAANNSYFETSVSFSPSSHWTMMNVIEMSGASSAQQNILQFTLPNTVALYKPSGTNILAVYDGNVVNGSANDGVWHSLIGVEDTVNVHINIDGSDATTGSAASPSATGQIVYCTSSGISNFVDGNSVEGGYWAFAITTTQCSNLSNNAHSYWGF